ncbi:diguanylate cyclase [Arcobacter sp. LA11]|uniref:transporter substrate-binding domain-containing diguanylate cyclase n=1 Tax=Arcobacter sp. LA11 TaxID=1898176 RepID=UPI000933EF1A|nr:transporter substrate-binding domain-containing protein [Arcobacter sp. LA11]
MKILFIQLLFIFCFSIEAMANTITFTKEEKKFIETNPLVKVAMMPDFSPFTYYIKDTPVGFEHDLLKIISKRTGLQFEKTINKWTTIYNAFKGKEVDMITSISYKKYREPFTSFTSSYYDIPIMIFVKDDFGEYNGLKSLKGKKVGVLKDVFYIKELEKMGTMNLVYYDNYAELTKDLVFGKIDALIQNLTNINYLIKKNVYTNLKLASELILPNTTKEDLRFGVQPEKPLLSSILQKALNSITAKEKEELVNKWIGSIKEYGGGHIELSQDEIAYLDTNIIKYCINPSGLPFEGLNEKGNHIGISSDYYNLFEKILSAKFELVETKNWNQSIDYIKNQKCDMLALGMETPERKKYLNFTSHYLEVPLVVATRVDVPFINQILDLEDEKIGIIKGDAFVKILRQKYPSLDIVEVEDIYDGLDKVKNGQLFAFIDTLASIGYEFQTKYFGELKIAGKISENLKLSIAVVKKDETLLNILQKTVNTITNEWHREIFTKWVPIKYEKNINYDLVWKIAIAAVLLILLIIYWNTKIIRANKLLKEAKKDIEEKNKELKRLSITDKLTNLYNRRKLEELLQNELHRSERFGRTFGLAILDIDHFKDVNDTYGHQIGDEVLKEIADILKAYLRKTDFVGRFGGEEFLIICPESDIKGVSNLMENFRLRIANHNFKEIRNKTASFGVTVSKEDDTMDTVIKRADSALYEAKNKGRNKVSICV